MNDVQTYRPTPRFPVVPWFGSTATFTTGASCPDDELWAVVVFVIHRSGFLLARVPRGWCTPSGHIEPKESAEEAARRETHEEAGVVLASIRRVGTFVVTDGEGRSDHAGVFIGRVGSMVGIPEGSESQGAEVFALDRIPGIYWRWDPLMEAMFNYAATADSGEALTTASSTEWEGKADV